MAVIENHKGAITEDGQLLISDAKQVVEIRPNLAWTKGSAIQVVDDSINKDGNRARRVYFGDDISDEDAFAQWQQDLTVLVGEANRQTHANHRLDDYRQTHRLLDALRARFNPDHP
jgi:trehalose-phosphatase